MRKKAQLVALLVIAIVVIFAVVHYQSKQSSTGSIKIGVIAPLTGAFADYGENLKNGVRAGLDSTTDVSVSFEDEQCDAKAAVSAYHKLADLDGVHLIIGPGCGSPQEAVVPLLAQDKTLVVVPSAASRGLFQKSGGWFYNIQYSLEDESTFNAAQIYAMGYKKVALITYENAFSKTHADSFRANYKGKIAVDTVLNDNNTNLLPELTKIKAAGVDAIYVPDIAFFFAGGSAKLKQLKMTMPVFTTYVAELPAVIPLVEGVTYSFPADVSDPQGAVYGLSKQAAQVLAFAARSCAGDASCVKDKLSSSSSFDQNGVYKRQLIMKKIVNGQPVPLK